MAKKDTKPAADAGRRGFRRRRGRREGPSRFAQLRAAYRLTKAQDPRLGLLMVAAFLGPFALMVAFGFLIGHPVTIGLSGLLLGLFFAMNLFARRAQNVAYAQAAGQPGAAAGIVDRMRGDWRVTPGVQFNRSQDLVHRVVSRAGVVLLAEGSPRGAKDLLAVEVRRVRRVAGDVPVHDVFVGDGEGQVPLRRLQNHLMKLPRALSKDQVNSLDRRLKALSSGPSVPLPKGPLPRSVPRGKLR